MKRLLLLMLVFVFLVSSCSVGRKKINTAADIGKDQVLIVGKIVYDPPMTKDTQTIQIFGWDSLRYRTYMICGTKLRTIDDSAVFPLSPDLNGSIETMQGETFYTTNMNYPIYMIGGIFFKEVYSTSCGYNCEQQVYKGVLVPASFYIDIKPDDANRAIYVGTIKYTRDNFWNVTRIQILDESKEMAPIFAKKFPGMKIRRALIRQPEPGVVPAVGSPY
jgi:hypothetical protein